MRLSGQAPKRPQSLHRAPTSLPIRTRSRLPIPVQVQQPPPAPLELTKQILSPILSPLATAGIIFIVAIFVLLQRDDLRDRLIRLFRLKRSASHYVAMDDAARQAQSLFSDAARYQRHVRSDHWHRVCSSSASRTRSSGAFWQHYCALCLTSAPRWRQFSLWLLGLRSILAGRK